MLFGIDSLYFWLAVIIISIAAEAATLGLCGIWFAAGGAAALVAGSVLLAYLCLKLYDEPVRRLLTRRFLSTRR